MRRFPLGIAALLLLLSLPASADCTYTLNATLPPTLYVSQGMDSLDNFPSTNARGVIQVTADNGTGSGSNCSWYIDRPDWQSDSSIHNGTGTESLLFGQPNQGYKTVEGDLRILGQTLGSANYDIVVASTHVVMRGRNMDNRGSGAGSTAAITMSRRPGDTQPWFRYLSVHDGCQNCVSPANGISGFDPGFSDPAVTVAGGTNFLNPSGVFGFSSRTQYVMRDTRNGRNYLTYNSCGQSQCETPLALPFLPNPDYFVAAIGDFNRDTHPDILWRNETTGANAIWLLGGINTQTNQIPYLGTINLPALPAQFRVVGVDDFDMDGDEDIVWHNSSTGNNAIWIMNDTAFGSIVNLPTIPDLAYVPGAVGDYDLDGLPDILWRNVSDGRTAVWRMEGTTLAEILDTFTETDPTFFNTISGPR